MTLVGKVVEESCITPDRKESIILIGLSFDNLSTNQIAEISGYNRKEVSKVKRKYHDFLIKDMERFYLGLIRGLIEENKDSAEGLINNYWKEYCSKFGGLSYDEVMEKYAEYAEYAINNFDKGNN